MEDDDVLGYYNYGECEKNLLFFVVVLFLLRIQ